MPRVQAGQELALVCSQNDPRLSNTNGVTTRFVVDLRICRLETLTPETLTPETLTPETWRPRKRALNRSEKRLPFGDGVLREVPEAGRQR